MMPTRGTVVDLGATETGGRAGVVWSLPHGGDLDANLVHLGPDGVIGAHVNDEVDVLLSIVAGRGELTVDGTSHELRRDILAVVPKGSRRQVLAGAEGLTYLSIHRRRGPLGIGPRPRTMSGTRRPEHRGRDLDDRAEVAEFVTRFYRQIAQDGQFHRYFHTLAHVDWHAHTLELTDFWAGILLGQPRADDHGAGEVIEAHRWLHDADPFDDALFERWLEIFDTTLDEGWCGPLTDAARRRAHGIAWAMAKRLTGRATRR